VTWREGLILAGIAALAQGCSTSVHNPESTASVSPPAAVAPAAVARAAAAPAAAASAAAAPAAAAPTCRLPGAEGLPARLERLKQDIAAGIRKFEKAHGGAAALTCPTPGTGRHEDVRDFPSYALAKLELSAPGDAAATSAAEAMLRCAFAFQTFTPDAPGADEGVFAFHVGDAPSVKDNSNEFALESLGPLLLDHPALSPDLLAFLEPRVLAAAEVVLAHDVCPAYTNICLVQAAELTALGRYYAQSRTAATRALAERMLASADDKMARWASFTRTNGLHEFDSPTYYATDLEALGLGRRYAGDAARARRFEDGLDYVWSDIAANTFRGRESLAGPYSRSYDLIGGHGALDTSMYLGGLRAEDPGSSAPGLIHTLLPLTGAAPYVPLSTAPCASSAPLREVVSTWSSEPGDAEHGRYAYITPDYALGTTSGDYGPQDMPITAELPTGPKSGLITVLPDYLDAPASEVRAGNFQKVTHLPLNAVAAQKGGTALVLLRVPARDPGYRDAKKHPLALANLSTNVLFPAQLDELLIDGASVAVGADMTLPARPVVTARAGSGVISVAILSASGVECPEGSGAMAEDVAEGPVSIHVSTFQPTTGGSHPPPMIRLAVYHSARVPADTARLKSCSARLALLVVADRCEAAGCAAAQAKAAATAAGEAATTWDPVTQAWAVSVQARTASGPGPRLHVSRGLTAAATSRQVDGHEMVFAPLSINGAPVVLAR
jgi:hypothetical protein